MIKEFVDLKIYDKKYNNNEALAEIYTHLKKEYQEISEYRDLTIKSFQTLEVAVKELDTKEAINKIVLYWVANLTYFSRVNFLINVVKLGDKTRKIKKSEIKDFIEIANSHIVSQIDSALSYVQFHISYFYFRFIEVRQEKNLGDTLLNIYLQSVQSAIGYVDKENGNSVSKFSEIYKLEALIEQKIFEKINYLENLIENEE